MKPAVAVLIVGLTVGGCTVDLVSITERTEVGLQLSTIQDTALQASILAQVRGPVAARVVVNGQEVRPSDALFDRFLYEAPVPMDSLRSGVRAVVSLVNGDSVELTIPAMTRAGAPTWTGDGLSVPVAFGVDFDAIRTASWSATALTADRGPIGTLDPRPGAEAGRIVVPDSLIPRRTAYLTLLCYGVLHDRVEPFNARAAFRSIVEVEVPERATM